LLLLEECDCGRGVFKGINFIPVGENSNFTSYVGENGIGKSSILEALDCFSKSFLSLLER